MNFDNSNTNNLPVNFWNTFINNLSLQGVKQPHLGWYARRAEWYLRSMGNKEWGLHEPEDVSTI